jgi:hypothetical protein
MKAVPGRMGTPDAISDKRKKTPKVPHVDFEKI